MKNDSLTIVPQLTVSNKFAVGNDIVFIPGFKASCTSLFKTKVYTDAEVAYCELFDDSLLRYASTWAAKEAVYKAFKQIYDLAIGWKKIEIVREKPAGRPRAIIHHEGSAPLISLSISHDGEYVWALALIEKINNA